MSPCFPRALTTLRNGKVTVDRPPLPNQAGAWLGAPNAAERSPPAPVRGVAWHTLSTHRGCDRVCSGSRAGGRPTARSTDGVGVGLCRRCGHRVLRHSRVALGATVRAPTRQPQHAHAARASRCRDPAALASLTRAASDRSAHALCHTTRTHQPHSAPPSLCSALIRASHDAHVIAPASSPGRASNTARKATPPLGSAALRLTAQLHQRVLALLFCSELPPILPSKRS
jgi:hypothetical protein